MSHEAFRAVCTTTTRVICAWCAATIRAGSSADADSSHGICMACVQRLGVFPTEDIQSLTDAQLETLPMGLIELDAEGRVQRYNEHEAAAAGMRVADVIGRMFFTEIAPCTSVREFRGRCEEMMRSPRAERDEIDFLFRFRSGDRLAHLVFAWAPDRQRLTILVDLLAG